MLFRVRQIRADGRWAFVLADMQDKGGRPVDYAGTPRAEAAAQGMVSRAFAALLRHDGDRWIVIESAIGPTDVAWEGWPSRYGAPPDVFAP